MWSNKFFFYLAESKEYCNDYWDNTVNQNYCGQDNSDIKCSYGHDSLLLQVSSSVHARFTSLLSNVHLSEKRAGIDKRNLQARRPTMLMKMTIMNRFSTGTGSTDSQPYSSLTITSPDKPVKSTSALELLAFITHSQSLYLHTRCPICGDMNFCFYIMQKKMPGVIYNHWFTVKLTFSAHWRHLRKYILLLNCNILLVIVYHDILLIPIHTLFRPILEQAWAIEVKCLSHLPDCDLFLLPAHTHKTKLNTEAFLSATCSCRAQSSVMESLLKFADKPGLCGAKLRLSQVV